jgi:hypothetical protein
MESGIILLSAKLNPKLPFWMKFFLIGAAILKCGVGEGWRRSVGPIM